MPGPRLSTSNARLRNHVLVIRLNAKADVYHADHGRVYTFETPFFLTAGGGLAFKRNGNVFAVSNFDLFDGHGRPVVADDGSLNL